MSSLGALGSAVLAACHTCCMPHAVAAVLAVVAAVGGAWNWAGALTILLGHYSAIYATTLADPAVLGVAWVII